MEPISASAEVAARQLRPRHRSADRTSRPRQPDARQGRSGVRSVRHLNLLTGGRRLLPLSIARIRCFHRDDPSVRPLATLRAHLENRPEVLAS